jgi:hypothetical protein
MALVCNESSTRDLVLHMLLASDDKCVSFDGMAVSEIDSDGMEREWGSKYPVAVLPLRQLDHPVVDYSTAVKAEGITTEAEALVCSIVGVAPAVVHDVMAVHVGDPANWRAALARLLLTSKAARHGVLIVEESPHTRDIIDVLLAVRPWIQPTVIVLSADAAACTKAIRRLYASFVKELEAYRMVSLQDADHPTPPRDGFFSSTHCPCGSALQADTSGALLPRCHRCSSGALGGWRCTACPYAVCIRCLDSERFVEARVAEGRDDSYTLAMSAPAAMQLVAPDVVGLVLRFACATVCEAHTAGSVCRSWRKGLLADEELWAVFFVQRWPDRRVPRRTTSTLYRARVLAELRASGRESLEDYRTASTSATLARNSTASTGSMPTVEAKPSSLFTPIEECEFAFKCPMIFSALRPLQRELGISGAPAEVRFCDVCTKKVYEVRSQAELEHHRSLGNCVSFKRENTAPKVSVQGHTQYVIYGDAADGGQAANRLLRQISTALEVMIAAGWPRQRSSVDQLGQFKVNWMDGVLGLESRYTQGASASIHVVLDTPSNRPIRAAVLSLHVDNAVLEDTAVFHARAIMDGLLASLSRGHWMGQMYQRPPPELRVIPLAERPPAQAACGLPPSPPLPW